MTEGKAEMRTGYGAGPTSHAGGQKPSKLCAPASGPTPGTSRMRNSLAAQVGAEQGVRAAPHALTPHPQE